MVPAALPAFSAPIGVRVVPSWLISDWDRLCAATALATRLRARPQAPMNVFCICILFSPKTGLEAYAEADSGKIAVNQGVVLAIKEVGVTDAGVVLVGVIGVQTDADRLGIFVEVGAVTLNVMGPGDVRAQVDTGNHVAVIQGRTQAVAPGEVGEVAVVFAPAGSVGRTVSSSTLEVRAFAHRLAVTGLPRALTEQGIATELGSAVAHATDVVGAYFTDQRQAAGAHYAIDEMDGTQRRLPEFLALIALDIVTRVEVGQTAVSVVLPGTGEADTGTHQSGTTHVTGIDLQRHVRTVAELTSNRHTTDVGAEADAIQADVFRMLEEITGTPQITLVAFNRHDQTRLSDGTRAGHAAGDVGIHRVAAMVVHGVETELGVVQRRHEPAEGYTELAAVTGFLVLAGTGDVGQLRLLAMGHVCTVEHQTVITTAGGNVSGGEEGTAVIRHGAVPFELVEGFHAQVFGQALGQVEHLDRQQTFLQLGARTAESGSVDRVDGVDAVLDEDTLTPADHLAAETDVTRVLTDEIVVIDEGVQQLDTGTLLQRVTAGVIDIVETLAAILGFEVIPVVATDKGTGIAVAQFQIVGALEDLGEHIAFLVVQTAVVRSTCGGFTTHIAMPVQPLVPPCGGHACTDRHLRVQLRVNLSDVEADCICRT